MKINICSRKVAEALLKDGFPKKHGSNQLL